MWLRGFPLLEFIPFFRIWDLISQWGMLPNQKQKYHSVFEFGKWWLSDFFFPEISFLEGAVKMCPVVSPQHSKASTVFMNKAWVWTAPEASSHSRWQMVTCFVDRTLAFVVLKTLIDSDREMWVNSNMRTSSSGFPGIELGSGWSIAPQKGESIVITPTPFSVQSLLWLQWPCHLLTGGRNSAGVNSKMVRSGVWCWH